MSKLGKLKQILGIIGQFAPQVLMFTPFAPIAQPIAAAMQVAQQFAKRDGETDAALNARRLQSVLQEGQIAAQAVNAQAGRTVLDPDEVVASGAAIIASTKQVINLIHDTHVSETTGNAVPPTS